MYRDMFMTHLQTKPGLELIRDNFMAACEVSPWADKNLVANYLSEDSSILIPVYAIRYDWLTAAHVESSMKFPTGPRQPSQVLAEDVVAACTPESLLGMMRDVALVEGCPIHDKHYVGHATDVTDPPLSRFFMHQLERPRHFENFEIPEHGDYLAAMYLCIEEVFDPKSPATVFNLETHYVKIEENFESNMINMDYGFLANLKKSFDKQIKRKFPPRNTPLMCNFNKVR